MAVARPKGRTSSSRFPGLLPCQSLLPGCGRPNNRVPVLVHLWSLNLCAPRQTGTGRRQEEDEKKRDAGEGAVSAGGKSTPPACP